VTSVGYFLVIPFLTVYLTAHAHMTDADAGLLFAALSLTRRGFGIPAGWASDRFGPARVLVTGLLIEAVAYLSFAASVSFWSWLVAVSLLGIGGSLNNMGSRSILAGSQSPVTFSRFYIGVNAAALIGPLAGSMLMAWGLVLASFVIAAGLHLALAAYTTAVLRATPRGSPGQSRTSGLAEALRDQPLMLFFVLAIGYWFFDALLYVTLPLALGQQRLPAAALLGPLNALNAAVVMVALWLTGTRVARRDTRGRMNVLALSAIILGAGWPICALAGIPAFVAAVAVVSLGEALFLSVIDVLAASLAPPGRTGLYLGFSSMAWAIGAVIGSLAGGAFGLAARHGQLPVYWAAIAAIGLATAGATVLARRTVAGAVAERQQARAPELAPAGR
jgi:MFS family permease